MPRQLKVYRTPIGFHDAYVAAPSQKAALQAWGSDRDLFARGIAELVTDPALTAAPLAQPGVVVKVSRGSAAEQIAALPATPKRSRPAAAAEGAPSPRRAKPAPAARPKAPKPDRTALEAATQALAEAEARQQREERDLAAAERELAQRRRALDREQAAERRQLEAARDRAARAYDRALAAWEG